MRLLSSLGRFRCGCCFFGGSRLGGFGRSRSFFGCLRRRCRFFSGGRSSFRCGDLGLFGRLRRFAGRFGLRCGFGGGFLIRAQQIEHLVADGRIQRLDVQPLKRALAERLNRAALEEMPQEGAQNRVVESLLAEMNLHREAQRVGAVADRLGARHSPRPRPLPAG